jgi:selenide,water dikinase
MEDIKLTQFSHGAGCGCKISPAVLDTILHSEIPKGHFPALLVGNESKDDAAVYETGDGNCIISTTDFFMPIVDDPDTFGAIASVNAISDVYAMLEGSRKVCLEAGIPLAGGHSIDCPEPVFGLAVTGSVRKEHLKRNDTAKEGSALYLTKSLGIGIITTAQKKGLVTPEHFKAAVDSMITLNKLGAELGKLTYVNALTDVTGFGLLGHLCEMCEGSGLSAKIDFSRIPKFDFLQEYLDKKSFPGGTTRNWNSYGHKVKVHTEFQKLVLADPQTSGGLLISVDGNETFEFESFCRKKGLEFVAFGTLVDRLDHVIEVV